MDENVYILEAKAYSIVQAIPGSKTGDVVNVDIYNVTDSSADTASTAMTFVNGETWSYAFTPGDTDVYVATIHHVALDVKYYKYLRSVSSAPSAGSGATTGSTLTVLRKEFLLSIDQYNSDDLTGDGSSGDQARRALNQALNFIYSKIKGSNIMQSNPSTGLASTADQDYIELSAIGDLDNITNLTDPTNQFKLIEIPFWKYRAMAPDPSQATGTPRWYARLFNRIYLTPRPDSVITYTADYNKVVADLSADSDQALIPAKLNYWIYAEANVFWQIMEDKTDVQAVQVLRNFAEEIRTTAMEDIQAEPDMARVSESHWPTNDEPRNRSFFDSPIGS